MKYRRILTDFNLDKWNHINIDSVENIIKDFDGLHGELFHPSDEKFNIITPNNIAIKITNITIENNCCYGDVECLDNDKGNIAEQIFENGGRLSIRGEMKNRNDFKKIITWDVVK